MSLTFEPLVGVGPLKFGMTEQEAETVQKGIAGVDDCTYHHGKLCAFSLYPHEVKLLLINGKDVLQMDKLSTALHLASHSGSYGQAQGGSLYFMDLGCAICQFESPSRSFLFFNREYNTGEPLKGMTPESIAEYYEDNYWNE